MGVAHILATFNNTIITLTDAAGNVISWSTPGKMSIKGSRKSTPFAGQIAAEKAAKKPLVWGYAASKFGLKDLELGVNLQFERCRMRV